MMAQSKDLDNDIDELLHDFEVRSQRPVFHCVLFYWPKQNTVPTRPELHYTESYMEFDEFFRKSFIDFYILEIYEKTKKFYREH